MVCCVIEERPHVENFPYKNINTISILYVLWNNGHRFNIEAVKYKT